MATPRAAWDHGVDDDTTPPGLIVPAITGVDDFHAAHLLDGSRPTDVSRDDRFFDADWTRRMVRDRLGIEADEIDGGHCVYLSRPAELAARLESLE